MLTTRFTDLVGCDVPIQQAGMGAVSPPALVAAVSNAGGLGLLGTARSSARTRSTLGTLLDQVHGLTDRPYGVNFAEGVRIGTRFVAAEESTLTRHG